MLRKFRPTCPWRLPSAIFKRVASLKTVFSCLLSSFPVRCAAGQRVALRETAGRKPPHRAKHVLGRPPSGGLVLVLTTAASFFFFFFLLPAVHPGRALSSSSCHRLACREALRGTNQRAHETTTTSAGICVPAARRWWRLAILGTCPCSCAAADDAGDEKAGLKARGA